jgi:hypothetical protein
MSKTRICNENLNIIETLISAKYSIMPKTNPNAGNLGDLWYDSVSSEVWYHPGTWTITSSETKLVGYYFIF